MTIPAHRRLAGLIQSVRFETLPPAAVHAAKRHILDSLGCLIGALHSDPPLAVLGIVDSLGGRPAATVIGTLLKTSAPLAALANGTALRYFDFNDTFNSSTPGGGHNTAHPSGNLPAVLAAGEAAGRSGADVIAALVAAYEVQLRLCEFAGEPSLRNRGWHNTTNLAFSAAGAAALLMSGDEETIAQAMAICATHQNTLSQLQEGAMATIKASADAWMAKSAIEAALLAAGGLTGPEEIFEGEHGWEKSVAGKVDYEGLLSPLGDFRLLKVRIKPFAAVGPAMAPIQAAVDLYDEDLDDSQIDKVTVFVPEALFENPATHEERRHPTNKEAADHSLFYCVAVALLEGNCGEAQYHHEKLASDQVHALCDKIAIEADAEFTAARGAGLGTGGAVRVQMKDGWVLEKRHKYPPGHPQNPLSDSQLERKFDDLAAVLFSSGRRDAIKKAVWSLDKAGQISDLMALLATK
jgi:2-methylcitrate dehydratase